MKIQQLSNQPQDELSYKGDYNIESLQVLKAICAFMVVFIHVNDFVEDKFVILLCRIAVPIFFMITGYFLLNQKGVLTLDRLRKSINKTFKLIIITQAASIALYACRKLRISIIYDIPFSSLLFDKSAWQETIISGGGFNIVLWYLHAALFGLICLYFIVKYNKLRILPYTTLLGLLLCYFIQILPNIPFVYNHNFFTNALPFFYLGMLIRLNEHKITFKFSTLICILIATLALNALEYYMTIAGIKPNVRHELWILTTPLAVLTFIVTLKSSHLPQSRALVNIGQKHSLIIYVVHEKLIEMASSLGLLNMCFGSIEFFIISLLISIVARWCWGHIKNWRQIACATQ